MMKAYRLFGFSEALRCVEVVDTPPTGCEILIRTLGAGVCHSDLYLWEGSYDLGRGQRLNLVDRGIALPLTMGHEIAGEIVAVGPDGPRDRIGEVCVAYPWIGCGQCRVCKGGEENLCMAPRCLGIHCDGGYAETVRIPHERYLVPIGDMDPAALAPFACSGLTTYSALKKLQPAIMETPVVIIGAGGLGLMAISILKGMGGVGAVVVDIDEKKRAGALAAGALGVVDGASPSAMEDIRAILGGPAWAAIDLVGSPETASLAFNLLAKGGTMVCIGLFGGATPWSLPMIPIKAARILGSYTGTLGELRELLDLVRTGRVQPIVIDRRGLAEADDALHRLHKGQQAGRAVLVPAAPAP